MLSDELFLAASLAPALMIAFGAGLLSFLSPCVLPVVAPYLAYMGGISVTELDESRAARARVLLAALFFVLGLSTVFLFVGLSVSALGRAMAEARYWLSFGAGAVVLVFGLHFLHVFRIPFLDREARFDAGDQGGSAFGAYVLGLAFAFGWTPCIGPILGAISSVVIARGDIGEGVAMLGLYSAGLGLPFLLAAAYFPRLKGVMGWMKRHMGAIEKVSGSLLVLIGVLMLTGNFTKISNWLLDTFPALQNLG
ncbi:MAG: cytochrome c-type biogenesis protein [Rhodobacteraceae bacterium HLUCCA08]|nr:MAG: cytochrome c-type biogenesis protein [Rhodobacteraceae bacterium HLUCCA08]